MAELQNTFSWSFSRHGTFETCLRRYYLNYYGSWGGWEPDAPAETREVYLQKKLTTIPMWTGTVVHESAETSLKGLMDRKPWAADRLIALAVKRAGWDVTDSKTGAWRKNPSRHAAFQEHYYEDPIPDETWQAAIDEIGRQVGNLLQCSVYRRLVEVPEKLREVEKLVSMDVDGVPVWVKLDALVDDGRGGWVVVDWKTGASHEKDTITAQLGVYGLYCTQHHRASAEHILAMHVNLRTNTQERHDVNPESLAATRSFILESARAMKEKLVDLKTNLAGQKISLFYLKDRANVLVAPSAGPAAGSSRVEA